MNSFETNPIVKPFDIACPQHEDASSNDGLHAVMDTENNGDAGGIQTNSMRIVTDNNNTSDRKHCPSLCCERPIFRLLTDDATGHQLTKMGDGALYMSNIFLSTSFIVLAKRDAGCDPEAEEECDLKVFGFKPTSLIMIIATLSSVLAIVFLPIIGAIVDYTPYRRALGITSAVLTIIVQAIQIGTVEETWFFMSLLQVVNSLNASAHALASWSYIPEIADDVGEEVMATYIPQFNMFMFGHQLGFLMLIISLGIKFGLDDAQIAQMSQGVSVLVSGMYYALAWYFFTGKGARHVLPEGKTLAWAGFEQVVQTIRGIFKYYHSTLGLYFISIVFAESAIAGFTGIVVTFLEEVLNFGGTKIGIVFLISLLFAIPGGYFSSWVSKKTSPLKNMKIMLVTFMSINFVAFSILTGPESTNLAWICSAFWGFLIGWYYTIKLFIFSHIIPKGQEAELTGFYIYFQQILGWFPPLLFTIMNEKGVPLGVGGMQLNVFLFFALICYLFMPSWQHCTTIAKADNKMLYFH